MYLAPLDLCLVHTVLPTMALLFLIFHLDSVTCSHTAPPLKWSCFCVQELSAWVMTDLCAFVAVCKDDFEQEGLDLMPYCATFFSFYPKNPVLVCCDLGGLCCSHSLGGSLIFIYSKSHWRKGTTTTPNTICHGEQCHLLSAHMGHWRL